MLSRTRHGHREPRSLGQCAPLPSSTEAPRLLARGGEPAALQGKPYIKSFSLAPCRSSKENQPLCLAHIPALSTSKERLKAVAYGAVQESLVEKGPREQRRAHGIHSCTLPVKQLGEVQLRKTQSKPPERCLQEPACPEHLAPGLHTEALLAQATAASGLLELVESSVTEIERLRASETQVQARLESSCAEQFLLRERVWSSNTELSLELSVAALEAHCQELQTELVTEQRECVKERAGELAAELWEVKALEMERRGSELEKVQRETVRGQAREIEARASQVQRTEAEMQELSRRLLDHSQRGAAQERELIALRLLLQEREWMTQGAQTDACGADIDAGKAEAKLLSEGLRRQEHTSERQATDLAEQARALEVGACRLQQLSSLLDEEREQVAAEREQGVGELQSLKRKLSDSQQQGYRQDVLINQQAMEVRSCFETAQEKRAELEQTVARQAAQITDQARELSEARRALATVDPQGSREVAARSHSLERAESRVLQLEEALQVQAESIASLQREREQQQSRADGLAAELGGARCEADLWSEEDNTMQVAAETLQAAAGLSHGRDNTAAEPVAGGGQKQGASATGKAQTSTGCMEATDSVAMRWLEFADAIAGTCRRAARAWHRRLQEQAVGARFAIWASRLAEAEQRQVLVSALVGVRDRAAGEAQARYAALQAQAAEALQCSEEHTDRFLMEAERLQAEVERLSLCVAQAELQRDAARSEAAALQEVSADERQCLELGLLSRELSVALRQFKERNEALVVENRSLRRSVVLFEGHLESISEGQAELVGHVNRTASGVDCAQLMLAGREATWFQAAGGYV
mmetsp:Transcript_21026/g.48823  ORF Transcript_21026/g.48823 Transcript_21026/m.48823 type:complete len:821 (+) Transcript_21026:114-2576(+)